MAVDRKTPTTLSHPEPVGIDDEDYGAAINEEVEALWQRAPCWLTITGGTVNAIVATCNPPLGVHGQSNRFYIVPNGPNTGAMTATIDGLGTLELRDIDAAPLLGGEVQGSRLHELVSDGTYLRLVPGGSSSGDASGPPDLVAWDQKNVGTNGGTFTIGAWRRRDMNQLVRNVLPGALLANNQITLQPGTYYIRARAPAYAVGLHKTRLFNVTDNVAFGLGSSAFAGGDGDLSHSYVEAIVTFTSAKAISLDHQCSSTQSTNGFGRATSFSDEIYSVVNIWRVGALDSQVQGRHGGGITIRYQVDFSTTVEADPGPGKMRFNNNPQNTATKIFLDLLDVGLEDYTAVLESISGGVGRLVKEDDPTKWIILEVTGRTDESGYKDFDFTVIGASDANPFATNDIALFMLGSPGAAAVMTGTSATSHTIGVGSKTFTASAGRQWAQGMRVRLSSQADETNFMEGQITSYSGDQLTVNVDVVGGSGTLSDWIIGIAGEPGAVTSVNGKTGAVNLFSQREVTAAGNITMLTSDDVILVNKTVGEATNVNLISAVGRTRPIIIKDLKGDAATNPIVPVPDGSEAIDIPDPAISFNRGALALYPLEDGSGWFVL